MGHTILFFFLLSNGILFLYQNEKLYFLQKKNKNYKELDPHSN